MHTADTIRSFTWMKTQKIRYAIDTYEIEEENPKSLEICKKEVQSLLRRCEEAGMTDYCYETLGPVLDRLGFIY